MTGHRVASRLRPAPSDGGRGEADCHSRPSHALLPCLCLGMKTEVRRYYCVNVYVTNEWEGDRGTRVVSGVQRVVVKTRWEGD